MFFLYFNKDAAWFHWFTLFGTSICHAINCLSQCKYIQIQWNIFICCFHDEESWPLIVILICLTFFMISFIRLCCGVWGRAWGWRTILSVHAHNGLVGFRSLPPRLNTLIDDQKPISLKTHISWPTPKIIQAPTAIQPQRDSLPLWHTAHQATPWSPSLTPHRDAFLHHLWGGVAQYSVWEEPRQTKVRN